VANEQGLVITSVRTPAGHLRLSTWRISPDGSQIEPIGDTEDQRAKIRHQTLMQLPGGVISAVMLAHGQIQLQAWEIKGDGGIVQSHSGATRMIAGHDLALCSELLDGNAPILTSTRTAQGSLKLIAWHG
jgi:hypothetical protein